MSYTRFVSGSLVVLLLLVGLAVPALAQDAPLSYAAVTDGTLYAYGVSDSPIPITLPEGYTLYTPTIIWKGSVLAFTAAAPGQYGGSTLMIASLPDGTATPLVENVQISFPPSFTAEGNIMYAASTGQYVEGNGPGAEITNVMQIAPVVGSVPSLIGSFEWGVGCGGGGSLPALFLYWGEVNSGPGGSPLALAQTQYGILHSTNCTGRGTALLDPAAGTDTVISDTLGWVSIGPDGGQAVGIDKQYVQETNSWTGQLVLVNLSNGVTATQPTQENPDLVVWGSDIFYSSQTEARAVPTDPAAQQKLGELIGSMEPTTLAVNTVAIHRVTVLTGEDAPLLQTEGFAIGRMIPAPDGALVFSLITSVEPWVNAMVAGEANPGDMTVPGYITVDLYTFKDGVVSGVGSNMQSAALFVP